MLVTYHVLPAQLKNLALHHYPRLQLTTPGQLLAKMMDFSEYKEKLTRRYQKGDQPNTAWRPPPLGEVYVPLRGEERRFKKLPDPIMSDVISDWDSRQLGRTKRLLIEGRITE